MFRTLAASICLIAFPVIATAQTRVDLDEAKNFTQYKTFTVEVQPPVRADGQVDERNTLVINRQRQAVTFQLGMRGLTQASADPDLIVRVWSRETERAELRSSAAPYGYWGYGPWGYGAWAGGYWGVPWSGGDVWTYRFIEGDMMVDVFEGSSGDLVYRAQVTREVDDDDMEEDAMKFAKRAFKKFPIGGDLDD